MLSDNVPVNFKVPALIVVSPKYVLEPDKVKIPDPVLVKSPNPEITPEIVSLPESKYYDMLSRAYANDLEAFIRENTNIKYWFHGHIHEYNNYMIGETNIVSNPRGYYKHHECEEHDNNFEIEV